MVFGPFFYLHEGDRLIKTDMIDRQCCEVINGVTYTGKMVDNDVNVVIDKYLDKQFKEFREQMMRFHPDEVFEAHEKLKADYEQMRIPFDEHEYRFKPFNELPLEYILNLHVKIYRFGYGSSINLSPFELCFNIDKLHYAYSDWWNAMAIENDKTEHREIRFL